MGEGAPTADTKSNEASPPPAVKPRKDISPLKESRLVRVAVVVWAVVAVLWSRTSGGSCNSYISSHVSSHVNSLEAKRLSASLWISLLNKPQLDIPLLSPTLPGPLAGSLRRETETEAQPLVTELTGNIAEQPATSTLTRDKPQAVSTLRRDKQPAISTPTGDKQPAVSTQTGDEEQLRRLMEGEEVLGQLPVMEGFGSGEGGINSQEVNGEEVNGREDDGMELRWIANRHWYTPSQLPYCTMDTCFNFSRCETPGDLRIYLYPSRHPQAMRYMREISASGHFEPDPSRACLLLFFRNGPSDRDNWPPPHWNGGLNHVIVSFHDDEINEPAPEIGKAALMTSIALQTLFRPGFDVSIPSEARKKSPPELRRTPPGEREYLLTFKGTRYLGEEYRGGFRSSPEFRGLHNGEDVVVATSCGGRFNKMLMERRPELAEGCVKDDAEFGKFDYGKLMNTTFALLPGGRQPGGTYRFLEAMSAGAIPVLVADNYVLPFWGMLDWSPCALVFPVAQIKRILPTLRSLSPSQIAARHAACVEMYETHFLNDTTVMHTAVKALYHRFQGMFPQMTV